MQDKPRPASELRERAEAIARRKFPLSHLNLATLPPEVVLKTLHELQVHQIELEMQNEELQRAQVQLDKARARYFDLYDLAPVGYCTVSEKGLVTEVNLSTATLLGLTRARLVNQRFSSFIAPTHQDNFYLYRQQVFASGVLKVCELQMVRGDSSLVWVSLTTTTALEDDGAWVLRVVLNDLTERKEIDRVLQDKNSALELASRTAAHASRAKSDFLSNMSHELRTPLNAVLGFAQLIDAGTPEPTPAQKRSVDQILKAGWYLLELINEILDLALVESGRLSLKLQTVALSAVLQECQTMMEPEADKRGISMCFAQYLKPYVVRADSTRVKQIFINLLSNAIKYNKPGGTVVVTCVETVPGRVRMAVVDTGQGLPPEKIEQLFQPFNRLGQEAHAEQGTGVGLVVTKRLVELMGGTMGVESVVGTGSTFWIEMNLTTEPVPPGPGAPTLLQNVAPVKSGDRLHTILYVEDNAANLLLVEAFMERRQDLRLLSARDGLSGIALAQAALPDVILMDIQLPLGMSGTEALKILRHDPATAHIPVVALSANAVPAAVEKGLATGFYRYLTKPLKFNEFMAVLDDALTLAKAPTGCQTARPARQAMHGNIV